MMQKISMKEVPQPPKIEDVDIDEEYDKYKSAFVNMVTVDVREYAKKHFER